MVSIDIIYITGAKASNLRIVTKFFGQSQLNSQPDETIDRSHVTGRRKGLCYLAVSKVSSSLVPDVIGKSLSGV